ncbi:hypothetical protein AB0M91_25310 [Micromonospora rifamycinica]|uniref:hypothetical protein n=1 Tax=Micromonospora rifamycinica TaxID=291594 RepID=UPI0033F8AECC
MRGSSVAEPAAGPAAGLRTEYPFVLPRGLVDDRGGVHREGAMRLATARDEIDPQGDPRVRQNPAFLTVLLLARTVTRIGAVQTVDVGVVERLFASDLAFLQDLYRRINQQGQTEAEVACPACGARFAVDVVGARPGGS